MVPLVLTAMFSQAAQDALGHRGGSVSPTPCPFFSWPPGPSETCCLNRSHPVPVQRGQGRRLPAPCRGTSHVGLAINQLVCVLLRLPLQVGLKGHKKETTRFGDSRILRRPRLLCSQPPNKWCRRRPCKLAPADSRAQPAGAILLKKVCSTQVMLVPGEGRLCVLGMRDAFRLPGLLHGFEPQQKHTLNTSNMRICPCMGSLRTLFQQAPKKATKLFVCH